MTQLKIKLDWIDALKAFAILGILLDHATESFYFYPWFSSPAENWPPFSERLTHIFPKDGPVLFRVVQFLGWLGDMGPGVFIFVSGLTLTLSALNKPLNKTEFYKSRALRIYPLYISIHLLTFLIAIIFFKWKVGLLYTGLSLFGLRLTNSLFWFLNPSWWFIWLIIQLYVLFPFLIDLLKKKGAVYFLLVTFAVTVISRTSGVMGFTFSADLSKWMTGLFCGTRLFEFSFGMYAGLLIANRNVKLEELLNNRFKLPFISVLIYLTGFVASWTYFGSIFSHFLITIGLSGMFYSIFEFLFKGFKTIEIPILWIGRNSYSTFLIHQTFMKFYGSILSGVPKTIVLIVIIVASFIAGYYIEKMVFRFFPFLQTAYFKIVIFFKYRTGLVLNVLFISAVTVLSFFLLAGKIASSKLILLIYLALFSLLVFYRFIVSPQIRSGLLRYIDLAIILAFVVLLFRGGWLSMFGILIIVSFLLLFILTNLSHWSALITTLFIIITGIGSVEYYLRNYKPLEIDTWGELPALKIDDETVYALIPNQLTHLRYNNYGYQLKTNSLGFNSSEINFFSKDSNEVRIMILGDAFSMPEGMNYEFSYPALLEKKMAEQFSDKTIHIINAGVTGYGPNEEYAQLKKYIHTIKPDVVINQLFINEFEEINTGRENRLKEIGLIKKDTGKKKIREKFAEAGRFQLNSQVSFFFRNITGSNDEYDYNKSFMYLYEKDSPYLSDLVIIKINDFLVEMNELCTQNDCEYVVLGVPGQIEVSEPKHISHFPHTLNLNDTSRFDLNLPLSIYQKLCNESEIEYLVTKDVLKNHPEQPVYFEKSIHWNKKGHEVVAGFLFDYLKNNI